MEASSMAGYANPDVLVSTDWVDEHKADPNVRLVEVDVDTEAYETGHIPGAVGWNWQSQLQDGLRRDLLPKAEFEALMSSSGIANDTTIVLYGDNNNWFATYAYWQLKIFGHEDVRIMNGGRKKWDLEGRELTQAAPSVSAASYTAQDANTSLRAMRAFVEESMNRPDRAMVDVRSPDEFTGKILSPPGLPETCQRGGHIPGAQNVPWLQAVNEADGTFKSADDLKVLYEGKGVTSDKDVIAYCRIGERSSHTWFALRELLGYPNVRNYDGSWTEWGNLVDQPVER
jgi:thiosulfate/3-mercaptopyruvate sulfurtransferase